MAKPKKLLRYEISSICNYRCKFCCWENSDDNVAPLKPLSAQTLSKLCRALSATGCGSINLTGGEPLLASENTLCETIKTIHAEDGITQLWATTNGATLRDYDFCRRISDAGLRELAVSIAAETDEKYSYYTDSDVNLTDILNGIKNAVSCGIAVRVHIPLNPLGVCNFEGISVLLNKLEAVGVKSAFFFRLHNSDKISDEYENLFIDPENLISDFKKAQSWNYGESESGRLFFTNGTMTVNIPRQNTVLVTYNCLKQDCGFYCQGNYAIYLVPDHDGWRIRACHRMFEDKRNEYPFDCDASVEEMTALLEKVWKYAYE